MMANVLADICDAKRAHIALQKARVSLTQLEDAARAQSAPRGFHRAIQQKVATGGTAVIAELKKASPSKGLIREDFHPETLAQAYVMGGATCLSVLTDIPYFQGEDAYLSRVRAVTSLPLLRKDFMLDPYQITEARALGADCILLIMACLSDAQAAELESAAFALGMDVLVEVHDAAELTRALKLKSRLLGINNRNLKTLKVDTITTAQLAPTLPSDYTVVCESGITTPADIAAMRAIGVGCFLIGESLMRQTDVTAALRALIG